MCSGYHVKPIKMADTKRSNDQATSIEDGSISALQSMFPYYSREFLLTHLRQQDGQISKATNILLQLQRDTTGPFGQPKVPRE